MSSTQPIYRVRLFLGLPFVHVGSEFVNAHGGPCLIMILTVSCGVVVLPVGKEKCRRDRASAKQPSTSSFLTEAIESRDDFFDLRPEIFL